MQPSKVPQARVAINRECRKRCIYCTPRGESGCSADDHEMTPREIAAVVAVLARYGVSAVKLTGGDPLWRNDVLDVIRAVRSVSGIVDLEVVTKCWRLRALAAELAEAGATAVTVSLDSLKRQVVHAITGVDCLQSCIDGIAAARAADLPVTINMVVMNLNQEEVPAMVRFAAEQHATLKLLDLIHVPDNEAFWRNHFVPLDSIACRLQQLAETVSIETHPGGIGHPMRLVLLRDGTRVLIKDATAGAWYGDICRDCPLYPCQDAITALWVTPDGKLKRCLTRDDHYIDVLSLLQHGAQSAAVDATVSPVFTSYATAQFQPCPWTDRLLSLPGKEDSLPLAA